MRCDEMSVWYKTGNGRDRKESLQREEISSMVPDPTRIALSRATAVEYNTIQKHRVLAYGSYGRHRLLLDVYLLPNYSCS